MTWSHLHVKVGPVRDTKDNFREIEWDMAILWQLRGLRGCYGVCMDVTGSTFSSIPYVAHKGRYYVKVWQWPHKSCTSILCGKITGTRRLRIGTLQIAMEGLTCREDTGAIPNFLITLQSSHQLADDNCSKIPDWTLNKHGINCHFVFNKGMLIHFPFFLNPFPPFGSIITFFSFFYTRDTVSFFHEVLSFYLKFPEKWHLWKWFRHQPG